MKQNDEIRLNTQEIESLIIKTLTTKAFFTFVSFNLQTRFLMISKKKKMRKQESTERSLQLKLKSIES